MSNKLRIAWFSNISLEEGFSLASYVSKTILPYIQDEFAVKVYHNSFEKLSWIDSGHFLRAQQDHLNNPYDLFFYNFEDTFESRFVRVALGLMPGVVYFHNFVLTDDGPEPILNSAWTDTVSNYNRKSEIGLSVVRNTPPSDPMAFREAAWSAIPVFSSPHTHSQYRTEIRERLNTGVDKSFYLPIPANETEFVVDQKSSNSFTICYCGSPEIEFRPHKLLQALERLTLKVKLLWLINPSEERWVKELLDNFNDIDIELVVGKDQQNWSECLKRSNLAIHTYFSVYGNLSPFFEISLMAGVPTIVNDFAFAEYLPDTVVFKIQPGETECLAYQSTIQQIASLTQEELNSLKQTIRSYAIETYSTQIVAQELSQILNFSTKALKDFYSDWNSFSSQAKRSLLTEVRNLYREGFQNLDLTPSPLDNAFIDLGWKD